MRRHGPDTKLYTGFYTDQHLRSDAKLLRPYLKEGKDIYVYFNNDGGGAAPKNAKRLGELMV